jgi:hypothetical protein
MPFYLMMPVTDVFTIHLLCGAHPQDLVTPLIPYGWQK